MNRVASCFILSSFEDKSTGSSRSPCGAKFLLDFAYLKQTF
ncbi:hypothetical protein Mpsy_0528 [Methanolobus psychrophilus R15]|nr:hypothetical protein Mpsy_0528 [Methanolobus psychrophilus R15]